MKDVAACEKSRGGGKQPVIREYPNGATQSDEVGLSNAEFIGVEKGTWGSETSQYPEEKKKTTSLSNFCGTLHAEISKGILFRE